MKSGSAFGMKIFSPPGGAFVVAKLISRELLVNGKIQAKHVLGFRTKVFFPLGVASVTAESHSRESLESGKIHAKHDKNTYKKSGSCSQTEIWNYLFYSYSGKTFCAATNEINVTNQEM
jgi:hypothetical protein